MCSIDPDVICLIDGETVSCGDHLVCDSSNFTMFINDIPFPDLTSAKLEIPGEISFNYEYDGSSMNLVVSGYSVDPEYMENILSSQNYLPTSQDFADGLVSLTPYMSIMIFILFVLFVFNLLKKVFK